MNIHGRAHPGAAPAAPVRHRHDTRGLPRPRVVVAAWAAPAREPSPGCRTQWGDNGGIWGGMGTAAPRRGTARSGAPRSTAAPMGGRARPPPGFVFRPPPLGSGPQAAKGNGVQKPLTPPPPLFYFILLFYSIFLPTTPMASRHPPGNARSGRLNSSEIPFCASKEFGARRLPSRGTPLLAAPHPKRAGGGSPPPPHPHHHHHHPPASGAPLPTPETPGGGGGIIIIKK